jgi:hypothetical protein
MRDFIDNLKAQAEINMARPASAASGAGGAATPVSGRTGGGGGGAFFRTGSEDASPAGPRATDLFRTVTPPAPAPAPAPAPVAVVTARIGGGGGGGGAGGGGGGTLNNAASPRPPAPAPAPAPAPTSAPATGAGAAAGAGVGVGGAEWVGDGFSPDTPVECPACLGDFTRATSVALGVCGHRMCYPCAIQTIRGGMSGDAAGVAQCPTCAGEAGAAGVRMGSAGVGGRGFVSEEAVRSVYTWCRYHPRGLPADVRPLSDTEVERFVDMTVAAVIGGAGTPAAAGGAGGADAAAASSERTLQCPNPACRRPIVVDVPATAPPVESRCPYCTTTTLCRSCGMAWAPHHAGQSCEAAAAAVRREAAAAMAAQELNAGAIAGSWKPCPGCGEALSKFRCVTRGGGGGGGGGGLDWLTHSHPSPRPLAQVTRVPPRHVPLLGADVHRVHGRVALPQRLRHLLQRRA